MVVSVLLFIVRVGGAAPSPSQLKAFAAQVPAELYAALGEEGAAACNPQSDPFCGSECDCLKFCLGQCSINGTAEKVEQKAYRMTMEGVYDLNEKNTGDVSGDMSFVLGQRVHAYMCRQQPNSIQCANLAQFQGDTPNNTDLVLEINMTMDGQWGPYLYCNPQNATQPKGGWACLTRLNLSSPLVPPACNEDFSIISDTEWSFTSDIKPVPGGGDTPGSCCAAATTNKVGVWTFFTGNKTCVTGSGMDQKEPFVAHDGAISAFSKKLMPKACDCPRVHKTVGRENLTVVFGNPQTDPQAAQYPTGGEWYSHPTAGRCTGGHTVGDGSGCTWEGKVAKVIEAKCMYKLVDANIEAMGKACFDSCPQPSNHTSSCYLSCFSNVTLTAPRAALLEPWAQAFEGGCPLQPLPGDGGQQRS